MSASEPFNYLIHKIVFFDGACGLCNTAVTFFMKRDTSKLLHFAPLQGETAKKLLPSELREAQALSTLVYYRSGQNKGTLPTLFLRSKAVAYILYDIGGICRIISLSLFAVPRVIGDFFYQIIARNRHLFLPQPLCETPRKRELERILD